MSLGALGDHQLKPVDLHELALERRSDVVRHSIGASARIDRLNLNDGIIHRRQIVDRKAQVTENSEENHRHGQDRRHDGPANE